MASSQAEQGAGRRRLMRFVLTVLALALAGSGCHRDSFLLSGTVTVSAGMRHKALPSNSVIFIIAKNPGGVPVAVHRVVNPQFPLSFTITQEDLLMPELPSDTPLQIQVQMNTHGNVGAPLRGDFEGRGPNLVYPGERRIHIVLDRQV